MTKQRISLKIDFHHVGIIFTILLNISIFSQESSNAMRSFLNIPRPCWSSWIAQVTVAIKLLWRHGQVHWKTEQKRPSRMVKYFPVSVFSLQSKRVSVNWWKDWPGDPWVKELTLKPSVAHTWLLNWQDGWHNQTRAHKYTPTHTPKQTPHTRPL